MTSIAMAKIASMAWYVRPNFIRFAPFVSGGSHPCLVCGFVLAHIYNPITRTYAFGAKESRSPKRHNGFFVP
jgi:hypothetical protein